MTCACKKLQERDSISSVRTATVRNEDHSSDIMTKHVTPHSLETHRENDQLHSVEQTVFPVKCGPPIITNKFQRHKSQSCFLPDEFSGKKKCVALS